MKVLTILKTNLKDFQPWYSQIEKTIIKKDGVKIELTSEEVRDLIKNINLPPTVNFLKR